ncbi:MAG TPA: hypothetical protein VLY04_08090 [Bryobacteraceae bacterium]|nr:hypothetical protein [Bryobacteraceae bacterium]
MAGIEDDNVPITSSAKYFAANIPGSKLVLLKGGVQHYQFLASCTEAGRKSLPLLCADKPGADRGTIHEKAAAMAVEFFDARLGAARR